jgi:hypothetical protein
MVCSRCGSTSPAGATVCQRCGNPLGQVATPTSLTGRPALGRTQGKVDTSWLPRAPAKPGLTRAATSLASHRPASIWQAQTHDAPGARQGPLPYSQAASAALIPGVLLCAIYGTYQAIWRRGIFSTIANDPLGVSESGAHRSDTLNLVLLGFTLAFVVAALAVGTWWVRRQKVEQVFRSAAIWVASGIVVCVVAAVLCQGDSPTRISYAYVAGAAGTFAIGGGLGFLLARTIQSVIGDLRWLPRVQPKLPTTGRSGSGISAAGLATLAPHAAKGRLDTSNLVPLTRQPAKVDWSSLKRR